MSTHASRRRGLLAATTLGLIAAPLTVLATTAPAQAASATVVINEVYINGGSAGSSYTNKYVELRNLTGADINLSGMSIQYRSASSTAVSSNVAALTGTIPANGYYVIVGGTNGTTTQPVPATPGQTSTTINPANAGGTVTLATGTTAIDPATSGAVVDKLSYGSGNTPEGTGTPSGNTITKSLGRSGASTDTDSNVTDFTAQNPTPGASNTAAAALAATNPGNKTGTAGTAISDFTLAATGGTSPYSWSATGLPNGVTVASNGAVSGTPTTAGTYNVTATVTDSATPTAGTASTSFTITVAPATLVASNPGNKSGTVGTAISSFDLTATGGTTPYSWSATGLPAGVTVSSGGTVSGTPTADGTFTVTATVADSATPTPQTASTSFTMTVAPAPTGPVDIQILATNDFHGRIQNDTGSASAGAAVLAGAVKQLRGQNPNTVFAAAGDLIGASTFESFIAKDKPTIDALNEAGLEVSAVGNHEFDQGYNDLVNRVMAPYNASTNPYGGAQWKYLGANVKFKDSDNPALDGTWTKTMSGVKVGFIGAVTEHLPELVSPGGISTIKVTNIATAANAAAVDLKAAGAKVVVLLVHEGAAGTDCNTIISDTTSDFGKITSAVSDNIDAIVSGHTHLTYNCSQPVAGWSGRPVTERPIVSAGQYGYNLNQIVFTVDSSTGVVTNKTQSVLPLKNGTTGSNFNYPIDSNTAAIVSAAVSNADTLGAQPLGNVAGPFYRAFLANGTTENRGGESTLGNLVAEIQKWATSDPAFGAAQIAFMNPGGLRANLVGQGTGAFPRVVTYKDAANVQPFANTLVNEDLTGAQIKAALEQQWQPAGAARPFLKLGISKGFTYTYDPTAATGSKIKDMYLNGVAISPTTTYSVTVNSFLATGGDNFTALNGTGRKQDTGRTDLQAQVDYFAANASGAAGLPVDFAQNSVGVTPSTVTPAAGSDVTLNLTSLSMTGPGDTNDASVDVKLGGTTLGSFPVVTTRQTTTPGFDEVGTATAVVTIPISASGAKTLVVSGPTTGTVARVPITVTGAPTVAVQILATNDFHGRIQNDTGSASAGAAVLAGAVKQLRGQNPNTVFAAAGDLIGASTFESFIAKDKPTIDALNEAGLEVSAVGNHEFDQGYNDLVNRVMAPYDATTNPYGGANWKYLGANVKFKDSNNPALDGTWMKTMSGVQVGFIGAVTEHLPELVSPGGISTIKVTDIPTAANAAAADLKAAGADVVVLLVHEGAAGTNCSTIASDTTSDFGKITAGVSDNIDAIVSGHTHLTYNCSLPVAGWASSDRPVTERPVVSAGQYGYNLNQIVFTVEPTSGVVQAKSQAVLPLKAGTTGSNFNYPVDSNTAAIVSAAVSNANTLGAQPLGNIAGPFYRAFLANGTTENRGGESTLGNLVAEIQKSATSDPAFGAAQIAFMNPGGLRADLVGQGTGAFPRVVTYKDAANVQPFANTLVNEDLTGAQIKAALEQQWQPSGAARPFLKLGISKGFTYTYDPTAPVGSRIKEMYLNGTPISLSATYSVTVNSFLATGGDNFTALAGTGRKQDTGRTDLQAQVDYFATNASGAAGLPVDYKQNSVGATVTTATPQAGKDVTINLTSLSMTGPNDVNDAAVTVSLGSKTLGSFPVTTTRQAATPGFDEVGTATAVVTLPVSSAGAKTLVVTGATTGTVARIPLTIAEPEFVDVQILATNDFHGRIQNDTGSASAGAAVLAGAVKQLRGDNPDTVFAAAGDLIGASTFESFIAKDKPTIDALNEAGLEVSAVGNHEFDQGYNDLVNRVMAPYNASTNPYGGAQWKYLGANVKFKDSGNPALDGTWMKTMSGGVQVGFIGAVTEHLPELVAPGGISNIQVTNIATAANSAANQLEAAGADVIVLLVHEGAAGTDCNTIISDTTSDFGKITSAVNDNIDAIVSGHTHLTYNCSQPVTGWTGRPVTERPIVSAGQYGYNLNQLVFRVNAASGVVTQKSQAVLPLKQGTSGSNFNYPVDPATKTIVDNAVAQANVLGAQPLGNVAGPFYRAFLANGTTENRGGESTLGNLVAEIQKSATSDPAFGAAQIAFMNPGGLRADLVGQGTGAFPRVVTYKDAANVQPFANTLVNEDLTGAQIKAALEQQWQPSGAARPFLKLGISKGFTYTYDPTAPVGSRIKEMYLNGTPISLSATYSVTVNSFLATGGDNFTALAGTGRKQDTGRTDLQAQVDYFAANASGAAGLPVDYSQRAVGYSFPAGAPATYHSGNDVTINLTSLSMTGPGDLNDSAVTVSLDGNTLGSFQVTTTRQAAAPGFDEVGTATAVVTIPPALAAGTYHLVVTGATTGTSAKVPFTTDGPIQVDTTVSGTSAPIVIGTAGSVSVTVTPETASGTVELYDGATLIGTATVTGGSATITVPANSLPVGSHTLDLKYLGGTFLKPSTGTVTVEVVKASTSISGTADDVTSGAPGSVDLTVTSPNGTPTGAVEVYDGTTLLGSGTLSGGTATVTVPAGSLAVGTHSLGIYYLGSATFEASSSTVSVTVVKATTSVTGTAGDITYGQAGSVDVTVTSAAGTPSGTVELHDGATLVGSTTMTGGAGTITVPALALEVGSHDLTLDYLGTSDFAADSGSVTVVVTKATPVVDSASTPAKVVVKQTDNKIGVVVSADGFTPSGDVEIRLNGSVIGSGTLNAAGNVLISVGKRPTVGTFAYTVAYLGDSHTEAANDTVTVKVVKQDPTMKVTAPASVKKNSTATVKVVLTGVNATVSGKVKFTYQGKTVTKTLSGGKTQLTTVKLTKNATIKVQYLGNGVFNEETKSVTVKVK